MIAAQEQLVTTVRPALLMISAAVGFLLLIVCANVANLILARLSSRRGEIAVRAALGAGRVQLVRQVLAESFVLSAIGGALGLLVAWAGVRFVHALPEGSLPRMQDVRLDGGVLLFALVVSVLVALVFGLVPALQASRAGPARHDERVLRRDPQVGGGRLLGALVVVEVALALMLLVGAGLMTRSFAQLMRVSPGFEPANLLAVQIYLPQAKYKTGLDRTRFYMNAIHRVGALPGVRSAAGVSALPMYPVGIDFALPFTVEGQAAPANGEEPRADIRTATPGYFETMKIALLKRALHRRARLPGRARHDRDQRDDGAALLRRPGSDRQGRAQPARQGRGRRHRRRRQALRPRRRAARRAVHAGVAVAAERHGAHRPDRVRSEGCSSIRSAARCWPSMPSSRSTPSARWWTSCRDRCFCRASACCCSARSPCRRCCWPWSGSTASCRTA